MVVFWLKKNFFQVKNDRLNKESIIKQIDILYPRDLKESVKKNAAMCSEVREYYFQ